MSITDMDCTTMSYLLGVILISIGLYAAISHQVSLNSGTAPSRHGSMFRISNRCKRYLPGPTLEGWDAVIFGLLAIALGVYLLIHPGPLLASFKICPPP